MEPGQQPMKFDRAIGEDPHPFHDIKQCREQYTFLKHSANKRMYKGKKCNVRYIFVEQEEITSNKEKDPERELSEPASPRRSKSLAFKQPFLRNK